MALLLSGAAQAADVKLENFRGVTIQAKLEKFEGDVLTLSKDGKTFNVPFNQFSASSQMLVKQAFATQPKPDLTIKPKHARGTWDTFFPNGLVDAKGASVPVSVLEGKMVCLYFGASWCGFCKEAVQRLKLLREAVGAHIEVVMIGHDHTESGHFKYMQSNEMPWPSVKWDDYKAQESNEAKELTSLYCGGLPSIVLLSSTGELLDKEAAFLIRMLPEEGVKSFKNWDYKEAMKEYRKQATTPLSPEAEKRHLDWLHGRFGGLLAMYERLLEQSKSPAPAALSAPPTWEQMLRIFYQHVRKHGR